MQEDTRDRLLSAATASFAEKGYDEATVRDICQRAGANLAAVNYYFGDKERLYIEAVKQAHRLRMEQVPLPDWLPSTTAADKLRGFIRTTLARMLDDPAQQWQMQLMLREMARPTDTCRELVQDFFRPHFELLMGILRELAPANTPDQKLHLIGFSIIGQCLHYKVARPIVALVVGEEENRRYTAELLAEHIADFSLAALSAGAKRSAAEVRP